MDKDATAANALTRMQEILANAAPYRIIKDAASLIQTVEGIDDALVTKRRDHVLQRIEVHIAKVQTEHDAAQASSDLRNLCLYPLQTLKSQLETQASIAHINQTLQGTIDATDEAFDKIEAASKPKPTPVPQPGKKPDPQTGTQPPTDPEHEQGTGKPGPPVSVKKRRIVHAAQLAPEAFLETQADVDGYLRRLRQELEAAIGSGERIEIR